MGTIASGLKKHLENLKKLGLDLTLVKGWETTVTKFGEFEDLINKLEPIVPQAQKAAADRDLAKSDMLKKFGELQNQALKLQSELKAPMATFWTNRGKLQDVIKKVADKTKQAAITKEFTAGNPIANQASVLVKEQNAYLRPVAVKPAELVEEVKKEQIARGQRPTDNAGRSRSNTQEEVVYSNSPHFDNK